MTDGIESCTVRMHHEQMITRVDRQCHQAHIMRLLFPSTLTARQRAALHKVADENGLPHDSSGEGTRRRITIGDANAQSLEVGCVDIEAC